MPNSPAAAAATACTPLQYLPDFKFWTSESARRYAKAKDYPEHAREAIKEMHRQARVHTVLLIRCVCLVRALAPGGSTAARGNMLSRLSTADLLVQALPASGSSIPPPM